MRMSGSSCNSSPICRSKTLRKLESLSGAEINQAKIVLATEATAMLHGREAARRPKETARTTFEGGGTGENLPTLSSADGMNVAQALTALAASPRRTAKRSARSQKARCAWTT